MRRLLVGSLSLLTLMVSSTASTAAAPDDSAPFDWGDAQACAVYSLETIACFASEAEMEIATAQPVVGDMVSTSASLLTTYCGGRSDLWLYIYEHVSFGGRVLKFRDPNLWQNLSPWGFDNQLSSWRNDILCTVYLAENTSGGGSWLTAAASSSNSNVGTTWNDRISSLFITT